MKFHVYGTVTISCNTVVEAKSKAEALKIAAERDVSQLTHQPCSSSIEDAWIIQEIDGTPNVEEAEQE